MITLTHHNPKKLEQKTFGTASLGGTIKTHRFIDSRARANSHGCWSPVVIEAYVFIRFYCNTATILEGGIVFVLHKRPCFTDGNIIIHRDKQCIIRDAQSNDVLPYIPISVKWSKSLKCRASYFQVLFLLNHQQSQTHLRHCECWTLGLFLLSIMVVCASRPLLSWASPRAHLFCCTKA